jgi:tRNA (guanine-N(7)-)-methyltransferase subunit TRM82
MAPFSSNLLVSGGGDAMLKVWDWLSGNIMYEVDILEAVQPFIMARAATRKRDECEGGGDDASPTLKKKRRLPHVSAMAGLTSQDKANDLSRSEMTSDAVLVVRKIDTLNSCNTHHIVFSAVGYRSTLHSFILSLMDVPF